MNNKVKQVIENIDIPEELHSRAKLGVEKANKEIEEMNLTTGKLMKRQKKWGLGKKITYFSGAAMLIICLLIGSTFVSPAMAKVMSNIPYLNQIVKSMDETQDRNKKLSDLFHKVNTTLSKNNDKIDASMSSFFSSEAPTIFVQVPDQKYKQKHEKGIKQIVKKFAQSSGVGEVKTKVVVQHKGIGDISEQDKKEARLDEQLLNISQKALKKRKYNFTQMSFNEQALKPTITIEIDEPKKDFTQVKEHVKKIVHNAIYSKKHLSYKVKVTKRSQAEIADMNWQPIFDSVMEETHKKFHEVNGFAYSFHPKPLEIVLKTSLSKGEQDKKKAKRIADYARQVVEIKRNKLSVEKIPYKIMIRDKEKEYIYEKLVK